MSVLTPGGLPSSQSETFGDRLDAISAHYQETEEWMRAAPITWPCAHERLSYRRHTSGFRIYIDERIAAESPAEAKMECIQWLNELVGKGIDAMEAALRVAEKHLRTT